MNFTERETAHMLAALRHCAKMDITPHGHFGGVEGGQLTEDEVDDLAERINFGGASQPSLSSHDTQSPLPVAGNNKEPEKYTVVGIHTNTDWEGGLHGASFVWHVVADSPNAAAVKAKCEAALGRAQENDNDNIEMAEKADEYARDIEIISVFEGHHLIDMHDPIP